MTPQSCPKRPHLDFKAGVYFGLTCLCWVRTWSQLGSWGPPSGTCGPLWIPDASLRAAPIPCAVVLCNTKYQGVKNFTLVIRHLSSRVKFFCNHPKILYPHPLFLSFYLPPGRKIFLPNYPLTFFHPIPKMFFVTISSKNVLPQPTPKHFCHPTLNTFSTLPPSPTHIFSFCHLTLENFLPPHPPKIILSPPPPATTTFSEYFAFMRTWLHTWNNSQNFMRKLALNQWGKSTSHQNNRSESFLQLRDILTMLKIKQECIPVGCVPSAAVAVSGGGVCPGDLTTGVSAQGGGVCPGRGAVCPWGYLPAGCTPCPVDWMTGKARIGYWTQAQAYMSRSSAAAVPSWVITIGFDGWLATDRRLWKHYLSAATVGDGN